MIFLESSAGFFLESVILKESYKSAQIVFTKNEFQEMSGVSVNVVSNVINQLVDLKIIVPDNTVMKKGYRYKRIYDVFVQ